ncbi:hypothetical protein RND71_040895 [Anisodus tanguticus]|uniref:Uncharacterized protein n=1 Tax=Anisodus tanguticus TaxID=243964 RepID=A0AAE1QTQ1_9SOLA|nr:hypothetical protein RND71_040895 [Anisodus tanguticus]
MAHMLDSWKGGILTMGTFGFHPLIKDQSSGLDDDIKDEDDIQECEITVSDHEDQNPLMYANGHEQLSHETPKANVIMDYNDGNTLARRSTDDESDKSSKKERITLADLFSADFPDKKKVQLPDLHVTNKKALKAQIKIGVSLAMKLIPRVWEDSRPIQKLQKVSQQFTIWQRRESERGGGFLRRRRRMRSGEGEAR